MKFCFAFFNMPTLYLLGALLITSAVSAQKKDSADLFSKKIQKGIAFYGWGHEPEWTVDLDMESGARFNSDNGLSFSIDSMEKSQTTEEDVTRYKKITEKGEMIVTLYGYGCTDSKTGEKYSHKVRVGIKMAGDAQYSIFEGCGNYLSDKSSK